MSEHPTEAPPKESAPTDSGSDSGRDLSLRWLMGGSIFVVILVAGLIFSIVIAVRGGDEPLVPAGDQGNGATEAVEQDQFATDPFFDEKGRVVYVPLNTNGVILRQSAPATGRAATTAPSGIMLQQVHENMHLPFSTSDGPTGFSDSGVATGFSRTAQGAGLAGVHYFSYLATGNTRVKMLQDAGVVSDPNNTLPELIKFNSSGQPGAAPDNFPSRVLQMIKVDYNDDLARVHLGATVQLDSGRMSNRDMWLDLVWRDGIGWSAVIPPKGRADVQDLPDFSGGWTSWW
ncbi:hypothetical protein ACKAMS_26715 [Rhodococcus sp. 5A-K4]|uniref:hypothetical protein n=1 Tax=Rhodococcus sp. 5A-K4 TaxID=3384442 RepID=UPI00136EADF0|nr:hypothetical protein [Rhodococcus erythropolis]